MALPFESFWKIYYYIALFATILFVIKLVLFATVGGDTEVAADFNSEIDTDCSFNFISIVINGSNKKVNTYISLL